MSVYCEDCKYCTYNSKSKDAMDAWAYAKCAKQRGYVSKQYPSESRFCSGMNPSGTCKDFVPKSTTLSIP